MQDATGDEQEQQRFELPAMTAVDVEQRLRGGHGERQQQERLRAQTSVLVSRSQRREQAHDRQRQDAEVVGVVRVQPFRRVQYARVRREPPEVAELPEVQRDELDWMCLREANGCVDERAVLLDLAQTLDAVREADGARVEGCRS